MRIELSDEIFDLSTLTGFNLIFDNSSSSSFTLLVSLSISSAEAVTLNPSLNTFLKLEAVLEISSNFVTINPS